MIADKVTNMYQIYLRKGSLPPPITPSIQKSSFTADFSTSSSQHRQQSLGWAGPAAGKRIWPQFSTRLFPCRTTFLSTRYRCNTTAWGGAAAVLQDSIAVVCVACKKRFFQSLAWPIHFYVNMTRLALSLPAPAPPLETFLKKVD